MDSLDLDCPLQVPAEALTDSSPGWAEILHLVLPMAAFGLATSVWYLPCLALWLTHP